MTVHLNTLFVTSDGSYLHKDHETVVVSVERERRAQLPLRQLSGIVCLGRASISPELMAACVEASVHVSFFAASGRFLGRIEGVPGGNVLLRRQQYRRADDAGASLALARSMVAGKIANARQFLLHARRDASAERKEALAEPVNRLGVHLRHAGEAADLEVLRGHEGVAARDYFGALPLLLKRNEEAFAFSGRSRRPPQDRVNALLSFGYALLMQDVAGALSGVGLDPAVGYLHEERPGRLCLALDMMEELRAAVVDRLVMALINRGQIGGDDVREDPSGGFRLGERGRREFLVAYQQAKQEPVRHGFLEQDTVWGRVPHLQALLLARAIRGELDVYPPFSIR